MILRRVMKHVKAQNWNEARKEATREKTFFRDLIVEMREGRTRLAASDLVQKGQGHRRNQG